MRAETLVDDAEDSPAGVEQFGCLRLMLSSKNGSGYKDVYYRKHLKKKPYQAMIYRESHNDHINLGTFEKAQEAAVAVAEARLSGVEKLQSPDKSRLKRGSGGELTPRTLLPFNILAVSTHCYRARVSCTGKRKLTAISVMPYNLNALPVPVVTTAVRELRADEREQAFAGVYPMALGKPKPVLDAANRHVLGTLTNGARLVIGGPGPHRAVAMFAPAAMPF